MRIAKRNPLKPPVTVFCDGGIRSKGRYGAYAFAVYDENGKEINRYVKVVENTTSSRMEMMAFYASLQTILLAHCNDACYVYSDSMLVVKGYNEWLHRWATKNWVGSSGSTVANLDIWKAILHCKKKITAESVELKVKHVKGHSGIYGNERADQLCNEALDTRLQEMRGGK